MAARLSYTPVLLYPDNTKDRDAVRALRANRETRVVDTLAGQFTELFTMRHPETIRTGFTKRAVSEFIASVTGDVPVGSYGVWAWYPWNKALVHVLPEELHTELRTGRNRNLITGDEQDRFYRTHVGIAGLSVGNAVAMSLVHTGGAKFLRIADGDVLSGSNTNRIRAGFDMVGIPKYAVAAREAYMVNPYLKLSVYKTGITPENIERFLTYPKPLDLVIDEMDTLYLKIRLRMLARKHGIPVIMAADNGDGIVVDIERFDLNRNRPLLHGQIPETELLAITEHTPRNVAAAIISRWVQPEHIDGRMQESLMEIGTSLYTWPQLGNAAFMAGSVLSYVARRILLGYPVTQGKVVIQPDRFFVPGYSDAPAVKERARRAAAFAKAIGI